MKLQHLTKRHASSVMKIIKKRSGLIGVIFISTILIGGFFFTRGANPNVSELSYIEHSVLGKDAGSMIPASCNSSPPVGHFPGDCSLTCPSGVGSYDLYWDPSATTCAVGCPGGVGVYYPSSDPSATACPAPGVSVDLNPSTVPYNVGYNYLNLSSWGANACNLYYIYDGEPSWHGPYPVPVNYTWGASGGLGTTLSYGFACYNGPNGTWAQDTVYVEPSIPSSPFATCNNAEGTNTTLNWGASANGNGNYYLRITFPSGQSCPAEWVNFSGTSCYPPGDNYWFTSYNFTTVPDQQYNWWVHGRNNYLYSPAAGTAFTCHKPSGTITFSPPSPSCAIATGASSCTVNTSWNVANPFNGNVSTLSRDNPNRTDYTQDVANNVPVTVYGPPVSSLTNLTLKNSTVTVDTKTLTATCASTPNNVDGNNWDSVNNVCADPQVPSASLVGQYYPTGTLAFTCTGSDAYSVDLTTGAGTSVFVPVTPYLAQGVTINNISTAGTYTVKCRHGSVSTQKPLGYISVPPPAVVSLSVSPATLSEQDDVTINWSTVFPTNACTLTAKVVCANNNCTAAQTAYENDLNATLTSTTTDANDRSGSRPIVKAITEVADGHKDNSNPIITVDWKALGKKTLRILYTTDLTYACSASKETKRIQVTKSQDQ